MDVQAALAAIHEPRRREILHLVARRELAAGDIHRAFDDAVTFGAISQHLKVLADAGLVVMRKDGRRRLYRARLDALEPLRAWLEQMWTRALDDLAHLAEAEDAPRSSKGSRR
jgi:DNA-binding transcriptional ArsR family regulator